MIHLIAKLRAWISSHLQYFERIKKKPLSDLQMATF
jgi:hypothetical protein